MATALSYVRTNGPRNNARPTNGVRSDDIYSGLVGFVRPGDSFKLSISEHAADSVPHRAGFKIDDVADALGRVAFANIEVESRVSTLFANKRVSRLGGPCDTHRPGHTDSLSSLVIPEG